MPEFDSGHFGHGDQHFFHHHQHQHFFHHDFDEFPFFSPFGFGFFPFDGFRNTPNNIGTPPCCNMNNPYMPNGNQNMY